MRDWLADFRQLANMTHEKVSVRCDITRQFYSMIENGERTPSVETAKRIAEVLNFDWTRFYDTDPQVKSSHKI